MTTLGPITAALEGEIQGELRDRGIVVWLDRDGHYTPFVDALAERYEDGDFFAPVVPFRGSYLEMLRELAPYGNGLDPEPLLVHMPGHTEETIRETPVLEVYLAGCRFRKALPTLIREAAGGRVPPDELDDLLDRSDLSLETAEAWLQRSTVVEPGLAAWLDSLTPEWILDDLIGDGEQLAERVAGAEQLATLLDHLYRRTGLDPDFPRFFLSRRPGEPRDVREAYAAWLMCVEYVHDLSRPPHLELKSNEDPRYVDARSRSALDAMRADLGPLLRRPGLSLQLEPGRALWWTFAGGKINHTLRLGLRVHEDWTVAADNFRLKIEGDGVAFSTVEAAIRAMGESAFWQDPDRQIAILKQLPDYRLSKFQRALPARYSVEMVGEYLLDIPGARRFLTP